VPGGRRGRKRQATWGRQCRFERSVDSTVTPARHAPNTAHGLDPSTTRPFRRVKVVDEGAVCHDSGGHRRRAGLACFHGNRDRSSTTACRLRRPPTHGKPVPPQSNVDPDLAAKRLLVYGLGHERIRRGGLGTLRRAIASYEASCLPSGFPGYSASDSQFSFGT